MDAINFALEKLIEFSLPITSIGAALFLIIFIVLEIKRKKLVENHKKRREKARKAVWNRYLKIRAIRRRREREKRRKKRKQ